MYYKINIFILYLQLIVFFITFIPYILINFSTGYKISMSYKTAWGKRSVVYEDGHGRKSKHFENTNGARKQKIKKWTSSSGKWNKAKNMVCKNNKVNSKA